ncbi:MAG: hypothetical protein JST39_15700 [Bacteroidetes bacterium]|nr:hypothetical protein [Bacteroidota bacterium]
MKKILLLICSVSLLSTAMAQLKPKTVCADFTVDIIDGKVNGLKASASNADIKLLFPCFTSSDEEGGTAKCGANVAFKDRDVTFFTQRDYIQIGPKFKGKMNVPLLGAKRGSLFKWLGNPIMKDTNWDAFQMNYGTLVLHYDATGKINLVQFSTLGTDVLNLCE